MSPLLSLRNVSVAFGGQPVVRDVSFDVASREIVGLVGESGSGKSVTALAILGLLPPTAEITGEIVFEGRDLPALGRRQMRRLRGAGIGMIFQEPMSSLNPVFTVGDQIIEAIRVHQRISRRAAADRAVELLEKVGIPAPRRRLEDYPHQMSGGMRQRVMIAIALSCSPRLLIADEPTTALDVTIQAQLLDLLAEVREEFGTAVVLITHNMGVIAEIADRVVVMYASRVVEEAGVFPLFDHPRHPYTRGLMASTPAMDMEAPRLVTIPGGTPTPGNLPPGCNFAPRCGYAIPPCAEGVPPMDAFADGQRAACIRARELGPAAPR